VPADKFEPVSTRTAPTAIMSRRDCANRQPYRDLPTKAAFVILGFKASPPLMRSYRAEFSFTVFEVMSKITEAGWGQPRWTSAPLLHLTWLNDTNAPYGAPSQP